ncbi:MAG: N-6 DNA methylase [Chloroflexota bacterium]
MPAPAELLDLIQRFDRNLDAYRSGQYNETQVRREFIDPFLKLLGWDVDNSKGYAEQYKDVVHEDAIKVEGTTKAPDYSLRIGGQRKLFVEAKKPSVNIKQDIAPAFQVRRYAWSAKLPLSILTDFEEFAVYDCRHRPDKNDAASHSRIMYFTFREYEERWDELVGLFSPKSIMQGAFDKFAQSSKKKRGTAEVDDAFLAEISEWRDTLARNIALRNDGITTRQLNHAVQRTIDRLIFLRIAEDRGIEAYGRLRERAEGKEVYASLGKLFQQADAKYNSGLFHFKAEKGRSDESLDTFTLGLSIDDKVLKGIIERLYYPDSPYQFDVIPADILGQVYEQFLGKVIRLTAGGQAKVEEKPEVKKAGGVFYTPTYIVDYIVEQTVGKLVDGKKPGKAGGVSKLRVLDPACGSGSFLIGAYQFLLDWHLGEYLKDTGRWAKRGEPTIYQNQRGEWRLTIGERKRILLNNIYGVDIDPQAVEVTKLSLLLKVMEGETEQTLGTQMRLLPERVLPNLSQNIQCGNSLIGPDFYDGQMSLGLLDEEEMYRVNVFDWAAAFPDIVPWGGFDAVIGNPPYIRIQAMKQWAPKEVEFYKTAYQSASRGNYDIYVVFVEKGLKLLNNNNGLLGFILPSKFFSTDYGLAIRQLISETNTLEKIIDFGHHQVFENATTYTCLLFLSSKNEPTTNVEFLVIEPEEIQNIRGNYAQLDRRFISEQPWMLIKTGERDLLEKITSQSLPLSKIMLDMARGSSTGADKVFVLKKTKSGDLVTHENEKVQIEAEILRRPIYATDFHRYLFSPKNSEEIIFPYDVQANDYTLFDESYFKSCFPVAYAYLSSKKSVLNKRKQAKSWYGYSAPRSLNVHEQAEIFIPLLANHGMFALAPNEKDPFTLMASAGFSLRIDSQIASKELIAGLINSKLIFWNLSLISNKFRGGWITCTKQYFSKLPIHEFATNQHKPLPITDQIFELVKTLTDLKTKELLVKTAQERTMLQRQIGAVDRQIDQLVYALYELTPEEIAIVEAAVK